MAEEVFFGKVTTGASDDLQKAHDIAHSMVTQFGMSDQIGLMQYEQRGRGSTLYSEETAALIDQEKRRIIERCTERTRVLVIQYKQKIEELSALLMQEETIDFRQIYSILGPKPENSNSTLQRFIEEIELVDREEAIEAAEKNVEKPEL